MRTSKGLAKREPQTIKAKIDDGFYVKVTYDPRGIFKWKATCYGTRVEQDYWRFDPKAEPKMRAVPYKIDDKSCDTRLGAIAWAKRILRRERRLALNPQTDDRNFIVR